MGKAAKGILAIAVVGIALILLGISSFAQNFVYPPTPMQSNYLPPAMGSWMMRGDPDHVPYNNQNPPTYYNGQCW